MGILKLAFNIFTLIVFAVTLMVMTACNRSSNKSNDMMHDTYQITLADHQGKKYLLKLYPDLIDEIGKSSKSDNVYFVKFKQSIHMDSLIKQPHVLSVVVPPDGVETPSTIMGQKGSASPTHQ